MTSLVSVSTFFDGTAFTESDGAAAFPVSASRMVQGCGETGNGKRERSQGEAPRPTTACREGSAMNVLLVEDDSSHAHLIQHRLAREPDVSIRRAATVHRAREQLAQRSFDLVLLDFSLPDGDGLDLFTEIRRRFTDLPVVFLTSADSAEVCARALKGGAIDYLVKKRNYLDALPGVIRKSARLREEVVAERDVAAAESSSPPEAPAPQPPDERSQIQAAFERNRWCRSRAAQDLGLSRVTLWRRMWKYNLNS